MNSVNAILFQIKKSLAVRGSTIDDVINDFDRRHFGTVSTLQFERMISACGLSLSPQEVRLILNMFSIPNGLVDLKKFSFAVNNVCDQTPTRSDCTICFQEIKQRLSLRQTTLRDLLRPYDRQNRGFINQTDFIRVVGSYPASNTIVDTFSKNGLMNLSEILNAYSLAEKTPIGNDRVRPGAVDNAINQLIERSIEVFETFAIRDRFKIGKLDVPVFQTAISTVGIQLSPADLQDIVDYYYMNDGNMVSYANFIADIQKEKERRLSMLPKSSPISYDLDEILSRIKSTCQSRKIRPVDLFPVNSVIMPKIKFSIVLKTAEFQLTIPEIDFLTNHFEYDSGNCDVSRFLSRIDTPPFDQETFINEGSKKIIEKLTNFLKEKKLQLAPRFIKFDREGSGEFNVSLINSVISHYGMTLSDTELELIQNHFPGHSQPYFRWIEFTRIVDPPLQADSNFSNTTSNVSNSNYSVNNNNRSNRFNSPIPVEVEQTAQPRAPVSPDRIPPNVTGLLQYVSQTARRYNMDIADEFREIDRMRAGFIKPTSFISFMNRDFNRLTKPQLDILLSRYGKFEFRYGDFCRDLIAVSDSERAGLSSRDSNRLLGASMTPGASPQVTNPFCSTNNYNNNNNSATFHNSNGNKNNNVHINQNEDTDKIFTSFLKRVKAFCVSKMMSAADLFQRHDSSRLGYISCDRIEGCFRFFQFPVSPEEVELLASMFHDRDHEERFVYAPLVKAIDQLVVSQAEVRQQMKAGELEEEYTKFIQQAVNAIREKLNLRRRRIAMFFADAKKGPMDAREFVQRLGMLDIVFHQQDIERMLKKYQNGGGGIDWEQFCHDVENSHLI